MVWQTVLPRLLPPAAADDNRLTTQLAHLELLGRALTLHADEHDGKFPPSIADIEWRQSLPGMKWAGLPAAASRFHHPDTGRVSEWLYAPGKTEADPPDTILAASPVAVGPGGSQRLVVRLNNVAEVIPEADFERQTRASSGKSSPQGATSPTGAPGKMPHAAGETPTLPWKPDGHDSN